jgi:DNA-directed RNA polymerase subunit RPC12/RpoP
MSSVYENQIAGYVCDACGIELDADQRWRGFVTAYRRDDVAAEWSPHGDYCQHCGDKLLDSLLTPIVRLERYCMLSDGDKRKIEVNLIKEASNG